MRISLNGNTQNLYTLMRAVDARFPQINVRNYRIYFPVAAEEAGNTGNTCKIGGAGITTDTTDLWKILALGETWARESQAEDLSLKVVYVRGSANATIIWVETDPA